MEYYIGLISGTSMDAVDAVLVDYSTMPGKIIERHSEPIHADLKNKIFQLISSTSSALPLLGKLDVEIGKLFAQTVNKLILKSKLKKTDIVAIGSHGQTVWHEPWGENPFTLQIGDPNIIAEETGITTVADFRRRDIAVGGQGAPLVPVFHETLFRTDKEDRVVLNLGGIANISVLPMTLESPIIGFDTGPANILCDSWIQRHSNKPYDENGCWALSGSVSEKLLTEMLADNYFNRQYPKSTGREYFNIAWVDQFLQDFDGYLKPEDVQATLVELTALTVQKGKALNYLV
ncbi:Anhydro-N-acetylmuramic acid kinase [Pseudolycoriella hygida]|uniref:Anhydro-N-acetylmuramic acid kinase n=1 Tax=Pseudolycoriella hygida TaxID=35572 RepID=A0A9Q0S494_9DIPT|nr:Anhydro-N-acetylmuramic acid kinase [Pseudolycoriella hygida]